MSEESSQQQPHEPPAQYSRHIESWHDAVELYGLIKDDGVWGFRGEPAVYPTCFSNIDRMSLSWPAELALMAESHIFQRFIQDASIYLSDVERDMLEDQIAQRILMRHYGAPTRLLDWSKSFWIALYFACCRDFESDARVLFFERTLMERSIDEDFKDETRRFGVETRYEAFFSPTSQRKLRKWVVPIYYRGARFPRLIAQQGFFTMGSRLGIDHWEFLRGLVAQKAESHGVGIAIIKSQAKGEIITELRAMGITGATMYPGVEGVCAAISHEFQFIAYDPELLPTTEAINKAAEQAQTADL